ncbi:MULTISPECIES: hypothetical protein [unclassified Methanoculleus]|jgi:hypothetical protein|uniref:hypothetical protein n=1 Tax=unclassified Methanoculleus TaxID=2619537 RepID=UPI00316ACFB4
MAEKGQYSENQVEAVVDCILVNYRGDARSRDRVIDAILEWAEEHPDEWEQFQARCRQRHEALA